MGAYVSETERAHSRSLCLECGGEPSSEAGKLFYQLYTRGVIGGGSSDKQDTWLGMEAMLLAQNFIALCDAVDQGYKHEFVWEYVFFCHLGYESFLRAGSRKAGGPRYTNEVVPVGYRQLFSAVERVRIGSPVDFSSLHRSCGSACHLVSELEAEFETRYRLSFESRWECSSLESFSRLEEFYYCMIELHSRDEKASSEFIKRILSTENYSLEAQLEAASFALQNDMLAKSAYAPLLEKLERAQVVPVSHFKFLLHCYGVLPECSGKPADVMADIYEHASSLEALYIPLTYALENREWALVDAAAKAIFTLHKHDFIASASLCAANRARGKSNEELRTRLSSAPYDAPELVRSACEMGESLRPAS